MSTLKAHKPLPLFPTFDLLTTYNKQDFPELEIFLNDGQHWRKQHWLWAKAFLLHIGKNKSQHTYVRFRNDIERFLLWLFLHNDTEMLACRKKDILAYADFCWNPPKAWINTANVDKFLLNNGCYECNPKWSPFKYTATEYLNSNNASQTKSTPIKSTPSKLHYQPSQQTLTSMFTAVTAFYNYLVSEEIAFVNPVPNAKKDCRHFIYDAQVKDVKRLTSEQWDYVFQTALSLANNNPKYERSLFVVCALKTLFLRISELSQRPSWTPVMSHFWEDSRHDYWLKVYGKGRKIRDITVPSHFLVYLKRYRQYRGLPPLPHSQETVPIVEKIRGSGGMTARHLRRLVQEIFDIAFDKMKAEKGEDKARKLKEASTHWLRHTGASMEIERGRALKDLSEDLGHASMATTDTIYVQTENVKRAKSGKNRTV